jgi:uncharacterized membrane protein YhaH (DUF805 family)
MEQPSSPAAPPARPARLSLDDLTALALGADPQRLSLSGLYLGVKGRIPRHTFWLHGVLSLLLLMIVVNALLSVANVDRDISGKLVNLLFAWPCIAVSAKRLHDFNFSAWWLLVNLTGIGLLVMLVIGCVPGTRGANRFGVDPREALAHARINSAR